jgi:hypothetical protein
MDTKADLATLPIILRESRAKLIAFLLLMIAFITLGVFLMNGEDFWIGFGAVVFCSVVAIVLLTQLRSNRVRSLRIDSSGLTYRLFGRSAHVGWNDIASFGIARMTMAATTRKFISWKYSSEANRPPSGVFMDMSLLGFDAGCPVIGLPAEDLLKLVNDLHAHYGGSC